MSGSDMLSMLKSISTRFRSCLFLLFKVICWFLSAHRRRTASDSDSDDGPRAEVVKAHDEECAVSEGDAEWEDWGNPEVVVVPRSDAVSFKIQAYREAVQVGRNDILCPQINPN